MKSLKCSDLAPGATCSFDASGETAKEVKQAMYAHAAQDHADKLASMSEEDRANINAAMDRMLA